MTALRRLLPAIVLLTTIQPVTAGTAVAVFNFHMKSDTLGFGRSAFSHFRAFLSCFLVAKVLLSCTGIRRKADGYPHRQFYFVPTPVEVSG